MKKSHFNPESFKQINQLLKEGNISLIKEQFKAVDDINIYIGVCYFCIDGIPQRKNIAAEKSKAICIEKTKLFIPVQFDKKTKYRLEIENWHKGSLISATIVK